MPSFSTDSPVSIPVSPSSSNFFLNNNKGSEGRGGGGQSPSLAFNSLGSAGHHARISRSSNPSPVLKPRTVVSSLSFNRGTLNKPTVHSNGSSVTRAASFQSRLNPSSYSMLAGPGSDNESLHSSTSSLDYSGGGGGALSHSKPVSFSSPSPQDEYQQVQPQFLQQHLEGRANLERKSNMKKFSSSYGSVYHSEMDQGPGMLPGLPEPGGVSHGSMPSLDLQIQNGGGGGMMGVQRSGGGARMSPGLRYASANSNWNGRLHNASSFGEVGYSGSKSPCQQPGPQVLKSPPPKAKETPRLNKFPLDLDSLVSSTSPAPPFKPHGPTMNAKPPKPPPNSLLQTDLQHLASPPSTSASPSASLSSLDSSSDTTPHHNLFMPFPSCSSASSQGSIPIPEMDCSQVPLSAALNSQLESPTEPQTTEVIHGRPSPYSPSSPRAIKSLEAGVGDGKDSVGSILQRIASFSRDAVTTTPTVVTQTPSIQSNGGMTPTRGCEEGMNKQKGRSTFQILLFGA